MSSAVKICAGSSSIAPVVWGTPNGSPMVGDEISLKDIIAEQLADQLQEDEFENYVKENYEDLVMDELKGDSEPFEIVLGDKDDQDTDSDSEFSFPLDDEMDHCDALGAEYEAKHLDFYLSDYFSNKGHNNPQGRKNKVDHMKKRNAKLEGKLTSLDVKTKQMIITMLRKSVIKGFFANLASDKNSMTFGVFGGSCKNKAGELITLPEHCCMRVFITTLEPEEEQECSKGNKRDKKNNSSKIKLQIVPSQAKKEMSRLMRIKEAGVPCPAVVLVRKHILVCEFLGENAVHAANLKNAPFHDLSNGIKDPLKTAYEQVVQILTKLYNECKMVHGNLSEYTIYWHKNQCYLKDVEDVLDVCSEKASECNEALHRDCTRIFEFFSKKDLNGIQTPDALFQEVTGFKYPTKEKAKLSKKSIS